MKIGFTGHRSFKDTELASRWVDGIATRHPNTTILTGGAIGADLIVAEQVVQHNNLKSIVVLPMLPHIFTARWNPEQCKRLDNVLQKSTIDLMSEYRKNLTYEQLIELDQSRADTESAKYEREFLTERNLYLVGQSDILIAFYDGRQSGGTFHAVQTALKRHTPVFQGYPHVRRQGKKSINSFSFIEKDEPLTDYFQTEEPCIEGYERLQAKLGYTNFSFFPLSSDRYASNGNVFERHDDYSITFREEPLAPSNSLIATLKATLNVESDFAKDIARQIEEIGIEHKDYFVAQFKKNPFTALQELQFLSDSMSDLQENPEDVMSRVNVENATLVQAFNNDPSEDTWEDEEFDEEYHVVNDPSTAWHRLTVDDSRNYLDPSLPLPPPPKPKPAFTALLEKAQTRTPAAGKEIYAISKAGKVKLSYEEWNQIWAEYKGKVSHRFGQAPGKPHPKGPGKEPPLMFTMLAPPAPTPPPELKPLEPTMQRPKRLRHVNPYSERALQAKKLFGSLTPPKPIAFREPFSFHRSEKVFYPAALCLNTKMLPPVNDNVDMVQPELFDVSNPARYPAMFRLHA